jgi:hypothetical protein
LFNTVCPLTVRAEEEALVSDVLPVTVNVPFEVNDEVAVIVPPVIELEVREDINDVTALKSVAIKPVDVVVPVTVAFVAVRLVAKRLVEVALVVEEFVAAKLLVAVALVTERLVNPTIVGAYNVPDTERLVVEALAKVVCPVTPNVPPNNPLVP